MKNNNDNFATSITESIRLLLQLDYDTTVHELEQKYTLAVTLKLLPDCKDCHEKNAGCLAHMIDERHKIRYSVPGPQIRYSVPGPHYGRCLFRMLPKKIQ